MYKRQAVARYYQVPLWSQEHLDAMRPLMKMLADAGQKIVTATLTHKPWNGQTEDYFETMVTWMKRADGTWAFDYTAVSYTHLDVYKRQQEDRTDFGMYAVCTRFKRGDKHCCTRYEDRAGLYFPSRLHFYSPQHERSIK